MSSQEIFLKRFPNRGYCSVLVVVVLLFFFFFLHHQFEKSGTVNAFLSDLVLKCPVMTICTKLQHLRISFNIIKPFKWLFHFKGLVHPKMKQMHCFWKFTNHLGVTLPVLQVSCWKDMGGGKETKYLRVLQKHLRNIFLLCLPYVRMARPHAAAHVRNCW